MSIIFDNVVNAEDVGMVLQSSVPSSGLTGTITVVDVTPAAGLTYPTLLTLVSQAETQNSSVEIFRVTAPTGNVFPYTARALNGTAMQLWNVGDFVQVRMNALFLLELQQWANAAQSALDAADVYGYLELSGRP